MTEFVSGKWAEMFSLKSSCIAPYIRQKLGKNDKGHREGGLKSLIYMASPTGFEPVLPP